MKRIRTIGLCLVTACVMTAIGAPSASAALPEYYKGGVPLSGSIAFKGKGLTPTGLASPSLGLKLACTGDTSTGKLVGPNKVAKVKVTYTGCVLEGFGDAKCQTSKTKPGVVKSNPLKGELVYATEELATAQMAALLLEPEVAGKPISKFRCGPAEEAFIEVKGSVLTHETVVNSGELSTGEVVSAEKAAEVSGCGKQQLLYVGGGAPCHNLSVNSSFGPALAWVLADEVLTYAMKAKVEVKA